MRLIDADELIKGFRDNPMGLAMKKIINSQPTAYDIDNVVEELKKNSEEYQKYNYPEDDYEYGFERGSECAFEKAIDIVKQGVR